MDCFAELLLFLASFQASAYADFFCLQLGERERKRRKGRKIKIHKLSEELKK